VIIFLGRKVLDTLSARLISHDTVFFSHNKTASSGLSAAETISRTACRLATIVKNVQQHCNLGNFNYSFKIVKCIFVPITIEQQPMLIHAVHFLHYQGIPQRNID